MSLLDSLGFGGDAVQMFKLVRNINEQGAKAFVSPVNLTLSIQQSNETDNSYLDAAMAIAVVTICAAKGAWRDPVGMVAAAHLLPSGPVNTNSSLRTGRR
jgi:hypothetical protein